MSRDDDDRRPAWPGLDDSDADLYYDVSDMRTVAEKLLVQLGTMQGPGGNRNGITGTVETLTRYFSLGEEHIGRWPEAAALTRSVGTGPDDRGRLLGELYTEFVERFEDVIEAIRTSADEYERTNPV
ncbi:hypothetical protein AB0L05_14840 [Nonomuraea pusilla]|uniref:hypothetical protein n=1 Tax=Nonomuraea pusilla TaxID=46177 RepID=UPI00331D50F6